MDDGLLRFERVSFAYPGSEREVSRGIDLAVVPGTVTAILGPNGAGKTTLLNLALGWLQPQTGMVRFEGRSVAEWGRRELGCRMALVPQRESAAFEHTVLETVLLGRSPHLGLLELPGDRDVEIALEAIARCGIVSFASRPVNCLSGGELQMVLLARALAQKPLLLLLDEPFSHLDLANKSRLLRVIRSLVQNGVTIILTTHEPEIAAAIATHLVLMREGQVRRVGSLDEVMTTPFLSDTYGIPVEVREVNDRKIVLWC
ncbi:MAG TPA: ABC transporter ATP-binding protein [Candidatus Ozemobacteraceae bacterium]|nr:ABC transporter ATP-binding protein [Candidatus Ozemobacteraceae bacterium]